MAPLKNVSCRPYDLIHWRAIEEAHKVLEDSMRILKTCPPQDVFLGRKNYEPIPLPYQDEEE
jgi:hypothetical protein